MLCPDCTSEKLVLIKTEHKFYELSPSGRPEDMPCDIRKEYTVECHNCEAMYEFEQDYNGRVVFVKRRSLKLYSG